VPLGKSEDLVPGSSEVYVIGYPGVGGATINVTRGTVSGFLGQDGGPGRFWIKTDAAIGHGNSGGTAIDETGMLIGIPTAFKPSDSDDNEHVGLVRPVELARPLIAKAEGGGWDPKAMPNPGKGAHGGMFADVGKGAPEPAHPEAPSKKNGSGWHVDAGCNATTGATVIGRVLASDNGAAVEGAYVVILKLGLRRKDVDDAFANIEDATLTYAVSDQDGSFAMPCPVPKQKRYSVIVVAKGFRELSADEILDTAGAPDRFPAWGGKILLQRK
jgi:S1-C subfamily serine protease